MLRAEVTSLQEFTKHIKEQHNLFVARSAVTTREQAQAVMTATSQVEAHEKAMEGHAKDVKEHNTMIKSDIPKAFDKLREDAAQHLT